MIIISPRQLPPCVAVIRRRGGRRAQPFPETGLALADGRAPPGLSGGLPADGDPRLLQLSASRLPLLVQVHAGHQRLLLPPWRQGDVSELLYRPQWVHARSVSINPIYWLYYWCLLGWFVYLIFNPFSSMGWRTATPSFSLATWRNSYIPHIPWWVYLLYKVPLCLPLPSVTRRMMAAASSLAPGCTRLCYTDPSESTPIFFLIPTGMSLCCGRLLLVPSSAMYVPHRQHYEVDLCPPPPPTPRPYSCRNRYVELWLPLFPVYVHGFNSCRQWAMVTAA